jgi:lysophospholipase L1-like esterase
LAVRVLWAIRVLSAMCWWSARHPWSGMTASLRPRSFVAIGDSFTEGLDDPSLAVPGAFRGWADRVAEQLADDDPEFAYANLAIRGRKLQQIVDEQVPRAIELAPELVSLAGGTNDVLRPKVDLEVLASVFDDAVRRLRVNGSQVLLFQSVDPSPRSKLIGSTLSRIKTLTRIVETTAAKYDCFVVPMWGAEVFGHPSVWSEDRLHLSPEGHARVAGAVLETLGLGDHAWAATLEPVAALRARERVVSDVRWARQHLAPWIGRRLRGVSSGDTLSAKYPDLAPVTRPRDGDGNG